MARRNLRQVNQGLNLEPSTSGPGMWRFPTNSEHCCIYRVPHRIRQINPKAYTPQLVILGPLHHSLKAQASKRRHEDIENTKFMGYLSMEQHKKIYLSAFAQRFDGEDITDGFRSIIEEEEETIRASYSESTAWIESTDFVEMILHDSVFILEFILRRYEKLRDEENTGDIVMDEPCLYHTIKDDLVLLENQLPFFILQKLFDPFIQILYPNHTFRTISILFSEFNGKVNGNSQFKHFTDLSRCVLVDSLNLEEGQVRGIETYENMKNMYNVEKLHGAGIKFKVIEEDFSLVVKFENGCLKLPSFVVEYNTELILRNIMALEQCHYPYKAYVCSYIYFWNCLIDTDKDVDFLVEKGIVKNWMGEHGELAAMVWE